MAADQIIKAGNRLPPLVIIASDDIGPVDLDGFAATFRMVNVLTGEVQIDNAPASIAAAITFTADASSNTLTATGHSVNNGEIVTLKSDGALPGNLSNQIGYYAINVVAGVSLQLSLTKGGSAEDITSVGSGTHSLLTGRITYDWQSGDTDTPGTYFAQVDTVEAGKTLSYPNGRQLTIEIISNLADASDRTKAIKAVIDRVRPDVEPVLTQGEIEMEVDRAQLVRVWQANTVYRIGDVIVPTERNGFTYACVQPGTSRASAYNFFDWPIEVGYTFGDGNTNPALVWECVGHDRFNGAVFGLETNIYDIARAARECLLKKAAYCVPFIDDGDVQFSKIRENCLSAAAQFRPFKRQAVLVRG